MPLLSLLGGGKGVAIIIAVIAIGGFIGFQQLRIGSLQNEVGELENTVQAKEIEITRLNGEVDKCKSNIELINNRIDDLKVQREEQKSTFDLLAENLDLIRKANSAEITELQNTEAPQSCELIMEFLRKGVGPA